MEILKKNLFPAHLIEKVVNCYITGTQSNHCPRDSLPTSPTFYFKLPYTGHFSVVTQKKIRHFIKRYCNDLDIKLVFSSFKIGNMLRLKDPVPDGLRSSVVYKFACAGCNACYVGVTTRHFFHTRAWALSQWQSLSHFQTSTEFWTLSSLVFTRLFPYFRSRLYEFPT